MTEDDFEALIQNWARWARTKPHYLNRCLSAEWRWDSRMWHGTYGDLDSPPEEPRVDQPNIVEALLIERAVRRNKNGYSLPHRMRQVLVGKYVYRARPQAIVRKARINIQHFEDVLQQARSALRNRVLYLLSKS